MDRFNGRFSKFFSGNNVKTVVDVPRERRTRPLPMPKNHSRSDPSQGRKGTEDKPFRPLPTPKSLTRPIHTASNDTEESSINDAAQRQRDRKVSSITTSDNNHIRSRSIAIRDERRKSLHTECRPSSVKNRPTEGIENKLQQIKKKHVTIQEPVTVDINHGFNHDITPRIDISWPENETLKRTISFKWEDLKAVAAEKQRIETEKQKANMSRYH